MVFSRAYLSGFLGLVRVAPHKLPLTSEPIAVHPKPKLLSRGWLRLRSLLELRCSQTSGGILEGATHLE